MIRSTSLICLCAVGAFGQTLTTLASFDGTNGANPLFETVTQGRDGSFYGTTEKGGNAVYGTIFKITPDGHLTSLHRFRDTDGYHPWGGLTLANDGEFYGTTTRGGKHDGTLFTITADGTLTTIYNFCSKAQCADGGGPVGGPIQASNGDFYGATGSGGTGYSGTIYKMAPSGKLDTLYNFGNSAGPSGAMVQATDGNLYGTTSGDVSMIFKITPGGAFTELYVFQCDAGCADGASPNPGLMQGSDGMLYGTTGWGAGATSYGTIFRMTLDGSISTLYTFCSLPNCADGASPDYGLVEGTDGNFYGTTFAGGANDQTQGTIFQITPAGVLTTLYTFCAQPNCPDGNNPMGGLTQGTDGAFYGTTNRGGTNPNDGTVFKLSTGLGPFVKTVPATGKAGSTVTILGTNLTGATSVTFNGTSATFVVSRATAIQATVPDGATTGSVEVSTPGGTLTSNVLFRVAR